MTECISMKQVKSIMSHFHISTRYSNCPLAGPLFHNDWRTLPRPPQLGNVEL